MDEATWRKLFADRIQEGIKCDREYAEACSKAAEYDPDWTPSDSADEEMSYWSE